MCSHMVDSKSENVEMTNEISTLPYENPLSPVSCGCIDRHNLTGMIRRASISVRHLGQDQARVQLALERDRGELDRMAVTVRHNERRTAAIGATPRRRRTTAETQ